MKIRTNLDVQIDRQDWMYLLVFILLVTSAIQADPFYIQLLLKSLELIGFHR